METKDKFVASIGFSLVYIGFFFAYGSLTRLYILNGVDSEFIIMTIITLVVSWFGISKMNKFFKFFSNK